MNFISKFTKKDFYFSVVTGLITGFAAWRILEYLHVPELHWGTSRVICGIATCFTQYSHYFFWGWIVVITPVLWMLGVLLGYFLGRWFSFFDQFGKFAAIGFTNAAVYFGILNILISRTDYTAGVGYSVISSISFVIALLSSYIWNKYWAFKSDNNQGGKGEFTKFVVVTVISFGINVGVASFVVNCIHPILAMDAHTWANVGAVAGSAVALIFSFVGFKVAVFKK